MPAWIPAAEYSAPPAPLDFDLASSGLAKPSPDFSSSSRCRTANDLTEIVVCGRADQNSRQRLGELDPRFGGNGLLPDGRFVLPLSKGLILEGGGPKGSAGITLKLKF
jgi:hypothetical protein